MVTLRKRVGDLEVFVKELNGSIKKINRDILNMGNDLSHIQKDIKEIKDHADGLRSDIRGMLANNQKNMWYVIGALIIIVGAVLGVKLTFPV